MKKLVVIMALLAGLTAGTVFAQSTLGIEVFKNQYCGCCHEWIAHLQKNGFKVTAKDVPETATVRESLGIPAELGSCHTAFVNGYAVEGHVPASDIKRLLAERQSPGHRDLGLIRQPGSGPDRHVEGHPPGR